MFRRPVLVEASVNNWWHPFRRLVAPTLVTKALSALGHYLPEQLPANSRPMGGYCSDSQTVEAGGASASEPMGENFQTPR